MNFETMVAEGVEKAARIGYLQAAVEIAERDQLDGDTFLKLRAAVRDGVDDAVRQAFRAKADRGGFKHVTSIGKV